MLEIVKLDLLRIERETQDLVSTRYLGNPARLIRNREIILEELSVPFPKIHPDTVINFRGFKTRGVLGKVFKLKRKFVL